MQDPNVNEYDYADLGLKVGIEIHQQLNSAKKLFCRCPSRLQGTRTPDYTILRKHRPVLGETGKFDKAMLVEFSKKASVIYEGYYDSTCSYELDETPPFLCNGEAVDIALEIASLLEMDIVREMHVCRKNYVDGSVPGGFQRTIEMAQNGKLLLKTGKEIGIENIFLEEDAARRIKTEGKVTTFRIDRLGIPLVEITTAPEIHDPQEAKDAAYRIGLLLRSTGKVKKIIGSIRQDINISIKTGERIEVKGVQKLDWIPELIKYEIQRQLALVEIKDELQKRGLKPENIVKKTVDLTKILNQTNCKFINAGIKKKLKVLGLKIEGFNGIYGINIQPNRRFGTEVAGKVKTLAGLKGLIHSDEKLINKYHFSEEEIDKVKKSLKISDNDLFVMLLGKPAMLDQAFDIIISRTQYSFEGVPPETRQANEDGTHEFLRELGGGARLYPDTDSRAITLAEERIEKIAQSLGAYPWDMIDQYAKKYSIEKDLVEDLIMGGNIKLFDKLLKIIPDNPMLIITTITDKVKVLHRETKNVENLEEHHFIALIEGLKKEVIAKEAILPIMRLWTDKPKLSLKEAKDKAGISDFDLSSLDKIVEDLIQKNLELVKARGRGAMGPLMGDLMKIVGRGGVDGKVLSSALAKGIAPYAKSNPKAGKKKEKKPQKKSKQTKGKKGETNK
jgi:glutamyl-tRNA(Gln) amidotransferase subunit E